METLQSLLYPADKMGRLLTSHIFPTYALYRDSGPLSFSLLLFYSFDVFHGFFWGGGQEFCIHGKYKKTNLFPFSVVCKSAIVIFMILDSLQ